MFLQPLLKLGAMEAFYELCKLCHFSEERMTWLIPLHFVMTESWLYREDHR